MLIAERNSMLLKKRLPYDAEVEYIESTGTQWIDTGIVPTNSHGFSISCALHNVVSSTYNSRAIGVHQGNVRWLFSLQAALVGENTFFGWNNAISNLGGYSNLQIVEASLNFMNDRKAILDGSVKASDLGNLGAISRTAYLFANNRDASGEMFLGRIFSCKISNGGDVVRDFIPVRVGGVGYMYDRVSKKLFGNQGTGDFVVGPDIVEVEYLQSTGTQWIDTGIYLTNNHSVEIDFQLTKLSQSRTGLFGGLATSRYGCLISPTSQKLEFGYGSSNVWYQIEPDTSRHYAKQQKNLLYVDDVLIHTFEQATFTQNYSTPLGNFNYTNYTPAKAKYYSSKWYDGDTLVRDFAPVRVGMEGAMMDRLTRKIYRNKGTGLFKFGAYKKETPLMCNSYIKDGLVAMWDGIENAGWGVHDPNATVWKDLSGSSDISTTGRVIGNYFVGSRAGSPKVTVYPGYCRTWEIVQRVNSSEAGVTASFTMVGTSVATGKYSNASATTNFVARLFNWQSYYSVDSVPFIRHIAMTGDGTTICRYFDGQLSNQISSTAAPSNAAFSLMELSDTSEFSVDFMAIRLYNRALTADEIAINYAVDKQRFNLP